MPPSMGGEVSPRLRRVVAPLSQHDFRLLWVGQAISALGDPLQTVALAWLVLELTNSPVALSGGLLAMALPRAALALAGGVITDRFDPRTVMLCSDIIRASAIGSVATLAGSGYLTLWMLYGLLIVYGTASGVFSPAAYSIIPRLVSADRLQAANSLSQMTPQFALIISAPLGGTLVLLGGPIPALALNAASFGIAALAALAMAPIGRLNGGAAKASPLVDIRRGFAYVWERTWLVALLAVEAMLNFAVAGPLAVGLPLLARENPHAGPAGFGLMLAGFGVGSIAGLLFAAVHPPLRGRGRIFCLLQLPQAPLLAGLGLMSLPLAVLSLAATGLLSSVSVVIYLTLIQTHVREYMLGRVMSLVALAAFGLVPLSQVAAGAVAEITGPAPVFLLSGVLLATGAIGGLLVPALRAVD